MAIAGMSSWGLFYILRWVLRTVKTDFEARVTELHSEVTDELKEARSQISELKVIVIRLIDRTRLLERELTDLDSVCRLSFNLPPKGPPRRTRSERREELEEELRNIGKGDND